MGGFWYTHYYMTKNCLEGTRRTKSSFFLFFKPSSWPGTCFIVMLSSWKSSGTGGSYWGIRIVTALLSICPCWRYCCQNASNGNRKYRMLPTAGQRMPNRKLAAFFQRDGYSRSRQKVRWSVKNKVWEK